MNTVSRFITIERLEAPAVRSEGRVVTPVARRATLTLRFFAFSRIRPVALTVVERGQTRRVAIRDWTRGVQVMVLTLSLVGCFLVRQLARNRRVAHHERRG